MVQLILNSINKQRDRAFEEHYEIDCNRSLSNQQPTFGTFVGRMRNEGYLFRLNQYVVWSQAHKGIGSG